MRLLVVSHTSHYYRDGQLVGWGPTVRELSYLAELFDELVHVAPVYDGAPPSSAQAYESKRVRIRPIRPAGGPRLAQKLDILSQYPHYARIIRQELRDVDAVHVRCPANVSLLALALLRRSDTPAMRWVKYAGNWQPEHHEPWSYGLQRRWLEQNPQLGVVTVNGRWPNQPDHVKTFDNPSLTENELEEGHQLARQKRLDGPAEILFVGALNDGKGVGRVLDVARGLNDLGVSFRLQLLGDGPERPRYEQYVADHHIHEVVFHGWVPRDVIGHFYGQAHFILLPSQSEGWPKVLSEGMAYGAVPIAGAVSGIAQVLQDTGAGVALPYTDTRGMAEAIAGYVDDPARWQAASHAGVQAAHRYGYVNYQQAVAGMFREAWGVRLPLPQAAMDTLKQVEV